MIEIECKTNAEAEAAIAAGNIPVLVGDVSLFVKTDITIVCRSGQPHVVALGSSQPYVEALGSSQPRVEAKGSAQVSVGGRVSVEALATVAVLVTGGTPDISGAGFVQHIETRTPQAWCDHYGVQVRNGHALLFKALGSDLRGRNGFQYELGGTPEAPDWDTERECGGGLHFSPHPMMAAAFCDAPFDERRYLCCPVALADLVVHPDGDYPEKCKGRRVAMPLWEVDEGAEALDDGDRELRDAFFANTEASS